jgi:hypothetical protein
LKLITFFSAIIIAKMKKAADYVKNKKYFRRHHFDFWLGNTVKKNKASELEHIEN